MATDAVAIYGREASPLQQTVHRTAYTERPTVEDMRVDHRGTDVRVPEQRLQGADVVAVLQKMRGERVAPLPPFPD